jgi:predicted O-linked N-acetylglucosamine transferase (SPINDLY family)
MLSRSLEIDIAIDLGGHTKFARTAIFANRAAPIQVNYLVYPGTMGSSYYDYIVADKVLVPVDQQEMYSEKIVYLPNSYQANDSFREISDSVLTRSACGLPEKGFVFCCFNNTFKILPEIFRIWVSILRSVDGSVLWLLADDLETKKNVIKAAESLGLDCNRLVFAPFIQHSDHLARLRLADLFLDTFPYNAHTTASDALRAGLPVLTIRGRSFASRVAASLLEAVGLSELIKQNLEDYRSDAIALAKDSEKLNQVREQIMMTVRRSSLFDTKAFTCHFENALTRMWTLYLEGSGPRHIYS